MSGVKDGTCWHDRAARSASVVSLFRAACGWGLCLSLVVGCQSVPTFRAQSPGIEEGAAAAKPRRRIDSEPSPDEESLAKNLGEGLPLSDEDPDTLKDPIADIVVEGNDTIEVTAIRKLVRSPVGRPPVEQQIREDVRALYSTRWFFSVEPRYRRTDDGLVLVFRVIERPMVQKVEFRGNERIKTKYLEKLTGLKEGSPFDVSVNREAARRIEEHYKTKGFPYTKVSLAQGDRREDRQVIFEVNEGPKVIVGAVHFEGNEAFGSALLKTKLTLKPAFLGIPFFGKYKPEQLPEDLAGLKQYYHSLGYFDAEIEKDVKIDESPWNPLSFRSAHAIITYKIKEGPRFQVRDVIIEGNQIFNTEELAEKLKLRSGDDYSARYMSQDVEVIKDKYGRLGRIFAKVDPIPRFLDESGKMDLVYKIDEDRVYTVRHVDVHVHGENPHTKEAVVRNRMLLHPGDLADPRLMRLTERRLGGQIFSRVGPDAPRVQVSVVNEKTQSANSRISQVGGAVRGQTPEPDDETYRAQSEPDPLFRSDPSLRQFQEPNFGGQFVQELPPGQVDIEPHVTEQQTGRLSFGVGVNSNSGVVGSIVLEENNFDILRVPGSFEDIRNGTAWRGGGQQFRMEAVPGNLVSRYLISWTDPYFLDSNYSVGVSGFFFNRYYRDWKEDRLGGRFTLGKVLANGFSELSETTYDLSAIGAVRLESVDVSNPRVPTPALLQAALGESFLSTARGSLVYDARDSQFLPAKGHMVSVGYEQAFGDFSYPRFDAEAHQYFTVFERPDGGGKHILSLGLQAAWTGNDTPIFERYYAGGFQSIRGFTYRGVSPIDGGVRIGGRWMFLGGAEYMVPITADEMLAAVGFCDFGTIEDSKVGFDNFRVTVGAGLRITVPIMGPAPIALDFGFPIAKQNFDDTRVFSFSVGVSR